jgi:hypothetical protein
VPPPGSCTALVNNSAFDACGTGVVAGRNADLVHAVKSNVHANANAGRNGKRPKVTRRSRAFIIKRAARRADEPPRSGPSATHAARLWMLRHCSTFTVRHCPVERRASNVSAWRQPNDSLRSGQNGSQRIRKILDTDAALWSAEALGSSRWRKPFQTCEERAHLFLGQWARAPDLLFITHSFGGLVVKQMLATSEMCQGPLKAIGGDARRRLSCYVACGIQCSYDSEPLACRKLGDKGPSN